MRVPACGRDAIGKVPARIPAVARAAHPFAVLVFGLAVAVIIAALLLSAGRPMTAGERDVLAAVYGGTVDLAPVRIARAPLPPALTGFVIGNHVIFRRGYYLDDFSADDYRMAQLVHEAAHVRANQRRGLYTSLLAVLEHLRYGDAVYRHDRVPAGGGFESYRYEQQARIAEEFYLRCAGRADESTDAARPPGRCPAAGG